MIPLERHVLGFALAGLIGLAALLGGAALVGANPAGSSAVAPSVQVPPQIQHGLRGVLRARPRVALAQARRAPAGRAVAVARGRPVGAAPGAPAAVQAPSPAALPPAQKAVPVAITPGSDGDAGAPNASPPEPARPAPAPDLPASEPPVVPPPVTPPPPPPTPPPPSEPPPPSAKPPPLLAADFENGLSGWNTAGVGEAVPEVSTGIVRDGAQASTVRLSGDQDRSELILGGNGSGSTAGTVRFREGDEYWYGFSFFIEAMVYGEPGAHNLIMQFKGNDSGSPNFGLQLWDYAGDGGSGGGRGLWSHGGAMGGDRFLAPVPEQAWHDIAIHFRASRIGAGFYELFLNGALVDARSGVSMIVPAAEYAYIKDGLYRNGKEIPGTSVLRLDAARLGDSLDAVSP